MLCQRRPYEIEHRGHDCRATESLLRLGAQRNEEAYAVRDCGGEIFGDCLAHVGEGCASAKIGGGGRARAIREDWDVLAGMIRGRINRIGIAAVVGGDDEQVRGTKTFEKRAKKRVKFFERASEAFDVFAMAVEHVEINEVCED